MLNILVATFNKQGVVETCQELAPLGKIFSTGGTANELRKAGVDVTPVSDLTGFPEILDGRVKTLHPAVHGGILARRDKTEHMEELDKHGFQTIDVVIVNLYPFEQTVAKPDVTLEEALENIDIGGPTMIRAAAKNFPHVVVVVDPADYSEVLDALRSGDVPIELRRRLALKAFQHVATYDTMIATWLRGEEQFPDELTLAFRKKQELRYGENPHQQAALYEQVLPGGREAQGVANAEQLHGKDLSYVNILDADAAWNAACDFDDPTVVIVKHMTPCGIASRDDLSEAFNQAFLADPISAFGGIIAVNRPVDEKIAKAIRDAKHPTSGQRLFVEIIVAPSFTREALTRLKKSKDVRLLEAPSVIMKQPAIEYRGITGGMLVQTADRLVEQVTGWKMMTPIERPTDRERVDLEFAWKCAKHVKSNAVVVVKDRVMIGAGTGQTNRVDSARIAVRQAGRKCKGAVSASDALIPFPDTVEVCARAGITAIVQTGGSVRDDEAIAVCNSRGMSMAATGSRHFRH